MNYCKQIIKKHFNQNLAMSAEDEERFQPSNKSWICSKLFSVGDNKVRDHDHVTGKYRDSHLIMQGIRKFDMKPTVIPNGLEKYMAFIQLIKIWFLLTACSLRILV